MKRSLCSWRCRERSVTAQVKLRAEKYVVQSNVVMSHPNAHVTLDEVTLTAPDTATLHGTVSCDPVRRGWAYLSAIVRQSRGFQVITTAEPNAFARCGDEPVPWSITAPTTDGALLRPKPSFVYLAYTVCDYESILCDEDQTLVKMRLLGHSRG